MSEIDEYVNRAKVAGVPDAAIIAQLRRAGWSENQIHVALGAHYEDRVGMPVPRRTGPRESGALDGAIYLSALVVLAIGVTSLLLLVNGWIESFASKPLAHRDGWSTQWEDSQRAWLTASLIVSLPIYLWLIRVQQRRWDQGATPVDSDVRLWCLSATIVLVASVSIFKVASALADVLTGALELVGFASAVVDLAVLGVVLGHYVYRLREGRPK